MRFIGKYLPHKSITAKRIERAARSDEYSGFCISCGCQNWNVEPDAREYTCESCGKAAVYGAEELMLELM